MAVRLGPFAEPAFAAAACSLSIAGAVGTVKSEIACFAAVCFAKHMLHGTMHGLAKRRESWNPEAGLPNGETISETARLSSGAALSQPWAFNQPAFHVRRQAPTTGSGDYRPN